MTRLAAALTILTLATLLLPTGARAQTQAQEPGAMVTAFEAARQSGDFDRAVTFVADQTVYRDTSGQQITGRAQIRDHLAQEAVGGAYALFVGTPQVAGNRVTWTRHRFAEDLRDLGVAPAILNVEATVEGGRITSITVSRSVETERRIRLATSSQETMLNLERAMAIHSIEAAMAVFADDAVVVATEGTYTGRAAIRDWIQGLFGEGFREELVGPRQVIGDRVIQEVDFRLDFFELMGVETLRARVEATIPDGRITRLHVMLTPESRALQQIALNKSTVIRFLNEINAGNLGIIDALIAPDFVDRDVEPGMDPGIEGARSFFAMMREGFADLRFTPVLVVAEDDLVMVRHQVTGTNTGTFVGMPPTGSAISLTAVDILRIRDGRMVERWGVADEVSLLRQLGVIPPMAMP
jgi:predicted ester cyclase/ketosteroid isomerase-like protein